MCVSQVCLPGSRDSGGDSWVSDLLGEHSQEKPESKRSRTGKGKNKARRWLQVSLDSVCSYRELWSINCKQNLPLGYGSERLHPYRDGHWLWATPGSGAGGSNGDQRINPGTAGPRAVIIHRQSSGVVGGSHSYQHPHLLGGWAYQKGSRDPQGSRQGHQQVLQQWVQL